MSIVARENELVETLRTIIPADVDFIVTEEGHTRKPTRDMPVQASLAFGGERQGEGFGDVDSEYAWVLTFRAQRGTINRAALLAALDAVVDRFVAAGIEHAVDPVVFEEDYFSVEVTIDA